MKNEDYIYRYWFPENFNGDIYIVCPRDTTTTYDANIWSDEYAYLDNFGDKDLLFLVYGFICRYYPLAHVHYFFADRYKKDHLNDWKSNNLIILGGPSWYHEISREFMYDALKSVYEKVSNFKMPPIMYAIKNTYDGWKELRAKVCSKTCKKYDANYDCRANHEICVWKSIISGEPEIYSPERNCTREITASSQKKLNDLIKQIEDHLNQSNQQHRLTQNSDGEYKITECLSSDIGIFAAFQNPYNINNRVIMISGAHTFGGVGAFRSFDISDENSRQNALSNYKLLGNALKNNGYDFISYFSMPIDDSAYILNQSVKLDQKNVISLCDKANNIAKYEDVCKLQELIEKLNQDFDSVLLIDVQTEFDSKLHNMARYIKKQLDSFESNITIRMTFDSYTAYFNRVNILKTQWDNAKKGNFYNLD